jgi:hypothetical protein
MKHLSTGLLVVIAFVAVTSSADALVLCANSSGSIVALDQCKAGMTQLDPTAVGLVGPPGSTGLQGPVGPVGPRGPSNGFVGDSVSAGSVAVSADTTAPTLIMALALPAGSYIVHATVGLHAAIAIGTLVPFTNVQCSFANGGGAFGTGSRTLVGGSTDSSASVPLLASVNLGTPDTVTVACSKDSGGIEVSTRASTITAIQVGTLTGP